MTTCKARIRINTGYGWEELIDLNWRCKRFYAEFQSAFSSSHGILAPLCPIGAWWVRLVVEQCSGGTRVPARIVQN